MEVGVQGGRLYTYRYTVTTRMTSALMWAAIRDVLMFHNCEKLPVVISCLFVCLIWSKTGDSA